MKNRLLIAGLLLAATQTALACGMPPELQDQLKLSQEQSQKLEALMDKHRQRMDAERQAMEKLHKQQRQDVASVLNADQMKTFDTWAANHRPPRPHDGPRPPRPQDGGND